MDFEYDQKKSEINLYKHGIDFGDAQELWQDGRRIEYDVENKVERRFVVVGKLLDGKWTAICTMRGGNVRIISVRRATMEEASLYDKTNNER